MDPTWLSVAAAFLSAIATIAAAIAAIYGPKAAAQEAEKLRRSAAEMDQKRNVKLHVFATIMQERAAIYTLESVRALNLIDIVFNDSKPVREAWANLYAAFSEGDSVPRHAKDERLQELLRRMAADLGLSDGFRVDDFARIYYPIALAQENEIKTLQRQAILRQLSQETIPSANSTPSATAIMWPPPPTKNG